MAGAPAGRTLPSACGQGAVPSSAMMRRVNPLPITALVGTEATTWEDRPVAPVVLPARCLSLFIPAV